MTREEFLSKFKSLTNRMCELVEVKNHDYGADADPFENFREFGVKGIVVRLGDKFKRIKTALWYDRELKVANETVIDTLLDLAVYSVIAILWISNEIVEKTKAEPKA